MPTPRVPNAPIQPDEIRQAINTLVQISQALTKIAKELEQIKNHQDLAAQSLRQVAMQR